MFTSGKMYRRSRITLHAFYVFPALSAMTVVARTISVFATLPVIRHYVPQQVVNSKLPLLFYFQILSEPAITISVLDA
ncbi:hypothetical protein BKA69DRAFT_1052766 [Paraphysoderma sedebokerense]|nr:hypothetical protein BKA69DRAFT_1052766 [Paraphysoderma sedebokerense]